MKSTFYLILMNTLFVGFTANAQNITASDFIMEEVPEITLEAAVDSAMANYPSIKARLEEKHAADEEVKRKKADYVPRLVMQEQAIYGSANSLRGTFWPNEGFAIPSSASPTQKQIWTGAFGSYSTLALTGPITSFGKLKLNIDAAKEFQNQSQMQYENELFIHKVRVTEAYLTLLISNELVRVGRVNLQRAQDLKNVITSKVVSGLRPGVDSAFVNAELSKAKLRLLDAIRREKTAQIKLAELAGLEGQIFAASPMGFEKELPGETENPTNVLENPLIKMYQARVRTAEARSKAVKRSWLPSLNYMAAGITRGSGFKTTQDGNITQSFSYGVLPRRANYFFAVYFLWDILSITKVKHDFQAAKYIALSHGYDLDEQKLHLTQELKNSQLQLVLSRQQAEEAPIQLAAAQGAYDQASARYESGLATLPELSETLFLLNRAEADKAIAYNNVWHSLLGIAASSGNLDLFNTQVNNQ